MYVQNEFGEMAFYRSRIVVVWDLHKQLNKTIPCESHSLGQALCLMLACQLEELVYLSHFGGLNNISFFLRGIGSLASNNKNKRQPCLIGSNGLC